MTTKINFCNVRVGASVNTTTDTNVPVVAVDKINRTVTAWRTNPHDPVNMWQVQTVVSLVDIKSVN